MEYNQIYVHLCCMKNWLDAVSPGQNVGKKRIALLAKYKTEDAQALGFKRDWQAEPLFGQIEQRESVAIVVKIRYFCSSKKVDYVR